MRWIFFGLALLLCSSATAGVQCLEGDGGPIQSGDFAKYLVNGLDIETFTLTDEIFESGTEWGAFRVIRIDGGETDGAKTFVRQEESGEETYGMMVPDVFVEGLGSADISLFFEPPLLMPQGLCVGDRITQSGDAQYIMIGNGWTYQFPGTYDTIVNVSAIERITVPYGSYDAWKFQTEIGSDFNVFGTMMEVTTSETQWVVPGLGMVRSLVTEDDGSTVTRDLVDTNRVPVPEPSGDLAALVVLVMLTAARGICRQSDRPDRLVA